MKKTFKIIFAVLMSLAAVGFVAFEIMKLPINSDAACMLLEAEDILSGNVFLSDWYLTGVSFLTSDLPWFVLGTAVFDVSLNAFRLTVFLMYMFMAACAAPLVFYKVKDKFMAFCVFLGVGVIPTAYALSHAFVHTAGFALSFLLIFAAVYYDDKPTKGRMAFLVSVCALGVCGDRIFLAVAAVPILAVCVFGGFKRKKQIFAGVACGTLLGYVLEKLWLLGGVAGYNAMAHTQFLEISDIPKNIMLYIEYFLRYINAYFFSKDLFSVKTGIFAFKILISAFALCFAAVGIKKLLREKKAESAEVLSAVLGIGFAIISLILMLTGMGSYINSGRYIAYLPLMLSVLLAKAIDTADFKNMLVRYGICAVFCLCAATNFWPHGSEYSPYNAYSRLADYLEDEGLTYGYASFWNSSVINVYSENKVKVRAVKYENEKLTPRNWFCKKSWYDDGFFVVVRNNDDTAEEDNYRFNGIFVERLAEGFQYEITEKNVISRLGTPKKTEKFENYSILIYDRIVLDKE